MNNPVPITYNASNSSEYDSDDGPSLHTRLVFACAWVLIAVAGIIGNSLVIFVAIWYEKFNNVTNCFIVNLAVTDIVFLAFCMPFLVIQYTFEHCVLVTVLTLVIMTIDRYIYVVHPFEDIKWRKPRTVFLLSLIIWLLSCAFASPSYFHYGVINDDNLKQCVLLTEEELQKRFRVYTVTLYYFIPLTIILICYAKLLYYVYSKENKLKTRRMSSPSKWSKRRRAVTKMVAVVTLVFSLCWLPITLYIVSANIFDRRTAFLYYFKAAAHSFAYLNSAINPLLYAFLNRSFRNNCENILSRPSCSSIMCKHGEKRKRTRSKQSNCNYEPKKHNSNIENNVIIDNNIELLSNGILINDFSDVEDELQDVDTLHHIIINEQNHHTDDARKAYGTYFIHSKTDHSRHLATTL
ncbi:unnamed protein product [Rotaria magnacalcarata]